MRLRRGERRPASLAAVGAKRSPSRLTPPTRAAAARRARPMIGVCADARAACGWGDTVVRPGTVPRYCGAIPEGGDRHSLPRRASGPTFPRRRDEREQLVGHNTPPRQHSSNSIRVVAVGDARLVTDETTGIESRSAVSWERQRRGGGRKQATQRRYAPGRTHELSFPWGHR